MRILVCTQKVNKEDATLGFFHSWLSVLAVEFDEVSVICLEKGEYDLPSNVTVYSLGKEERYSRLTYISRFYDYISSFRNTYDVVFVHMNQEYVLLGGLYWKPFHKKVYMWRNHPYGNVLTRLAVSFCDKVFCTSTSSFTAHYPKTVLMPAGVDTSLFRPIPSVVRAKYSVCMVGRISPIKHIFEAIMAIELLVKQGVQVSLCITGEASRRDRVYGQKVLNYVLKNNLSQAVIFKDAVSQTHLPEVYSSAEVCLNLTDDGSFDKTIVEAASCGALPIVTSTAVAKLLPDECFTTLAPERIASAIQNMFESHVRLSIEKDLEVFVKSQSLEKLMYSLKEEIHV